MLDTARKYPYFLFLLPVFYFLHQISENFAPGIYKSGLVLIVSFSLVGLAITLLFLPILKSYKKAALISFFLLSFNFFFGYIHDTGKKLAGNDILFIKYSFILPFILLTIAISTIWLRKTKYKFENTYFFLNFLLIILIVFEIAIQAPKFQGIQSNVSESSNIQFSKCDSCFKPNVFVIITDEYAGKKELNDILSFDNSEFEYKLSERGFYFIKNSNSNYNSTVYSIASLLNLEYIKLSGRNKVTQSEMLYCRYIIKQNNLYNFFQQQGYSIQNHSFFELMGKEKTVTNFYFPAKKRILTFGTFVNRLQRDIGFNFLGKKKINRLEINDNLNDEITDNLTRKAVLDQSSDPKFIYTHFSRPHSPYLFDRNGQPLIIEDSLKGFERTKKGYTEYLLYTNKRLLQLIDHILQNSKSPPVILLASDHGFRYLNEGIDKKYTFMNLCAVYLPNKQYLGFYDGMTNVNIFRAILNTQFGQKLPMLIDSTIYLTEKE